MRIAEALSALRTRLMLLVCRGVLKLVDDERGIQAVQASGMRDELFGALERWGLYGFTCNPHPGAEGLFLFQNGSRDLGHVIGVEDRRYRVQGLKSGEVAVYDDLGSIIKLKRGGIIEITCNDEVRIECSDRVLVTSPLVRVLGDVTATGTVQGTSDVTDAQGQAKTMEEMRQVFNSHTHPGGGGPSATM